MDTIRIHCCISKLGQYISTAVMQMNLITSFDMDGLLFPQQIHHQKDNHTNFFGQFLNSILAKLPLEYCPKQFVSFGKLQ